MNETLEAGDLHAQEQHQPTEPDLGLGIAFSDSATKSAEIDVRVQRITAGAPILQYLWDLTPGPCPTSEPVEHRGATFAKRRC